jgi:hypothetical protein
MAQDPSLSRHQRVGFPDSYRAGKEEAIFADITAKLSNLALRGKLVLDIGPGCSGPALMLIELCRRQGHRLLMVDSAEMLSLLPDATFLTKVAALYPSGCAELLAAEAGRIDVILSYSVLHYVVAQVGAYEFLDRSLPLMAEGAQMLIGDIPNFSKRRRFFSSQAGIRFHQDFTGGPGMLDVNGDLPEQGRIDDAMILGLIGRARSAGFDAYVVPQAAALPMANRREDVLVTRP